MSLGYAEKLSYIEDVGQVGMAEFFDQRCVLQEKIDQLAAIIKKSKHLVVFTGAGISTSCGIPDFRGPSGIWTLQREGKALPEASLPFHRAMPSMTHMALVELEKAGILKFVISQNIDGLHLRSGIPREKLAELHGNSFMEICPSCGVEYMRDFEVETIGLNETSRRCSDASCGARLKDTVLDWEDALPSKEMDPAEAHCRIADVVLCLGTSLQITPACNLPLKCLRNGGKIVIVNLQKTPKDKKASLVIHGLVDKVIAGVMDLLNLQIPPYIRIDLLQIIITQALSSDERFVNWTLGIASVHGQKAPLPFIKSVEVNPLSETPRAYYSGTNVFMASLTIVSFLDCQSYKAAVLHKEPFKLKRRTTRMRAFEIALKLNFSDGCGCLCSQINIPFDFEVSTDECDSDKDSVLQQLRDTALEDLCCGQNAVVERKTVLAPKSEVTSYAIVTNIVVHSKRPGTDLLSNGSLKRLNDCTKGFRTSRKRSKGMPQRSRY